MSHSEEHQQALAALEQKFERRVARERSARKVAEDLLETKSLDLFIANRELQALNEELEKKVEQRTEELSNALTRANAATKAKSDFLAVMSHEIRTPMNAVIGITQLLKETPISIEQEYYLQTLEHSGQLLLSIINDILDFSKIEAGKLELESIPTSLTELCRKLQNIFSEKIRQRHIEFHLNIAPSLPSKVLTDPTRLEQVLMNLLSNAIKFTERGSVSLNIEAGSKPDTLLFSIEDTGIGIDEKGKQRLFQAFSQADTSTTRQYGGTGLGLAISSNIVHAMQGQILVESEPNKGSRFFFEVFAPAATSSHLQTKETESNNSHHLNKNLRILLVEDNLINQMLALKFLERLNLKAKTANNGLEGLNAVRTQPFDIVLMDMQMPQMDGILATQEIRKLGDHIHQPRIIALTANAFEDDRRRCFDAGMNNFLSKPINLDKLSEALLEEQNQLSEA